QRFLLSAGQYDKTLDENMLDIVDDTIRNLESFGSRDKNIIKMAEGLKQRLISFSQTSAGQLVSEWDGDIFEDLHNLEKSVFDIFRNPVISKNIEGSLNSSSGKYGDLALDVLIKDLFGLEFSDIKAGVIAFFFPEQKENKSKILSSHLFTGIFNVVSGNGKLSLENIIAVSPKLRERIKNSLTNTLIGIVDNNVPKILESIDVNTLVVDKIDTLDMAKVEKLILDIVRKQLRWINLFGALLGSVIGGAQLLLNMFM
ncbi:MAG: DUF445 family protein, partial [Spirochaetales bacterium]|nr:DUF445 family protein [Spirochaetales bacterium]